MSDSSKIIFNAIGTSWVIDIYSKKIEKPNLLKKKIDEEIKKFSDIFSRFDVNSEISKASVSGGEIKMPDEYLPLLSLYSRLYKVTSGLFTPLIGNLLEDAGYDANYSLKPKKLRPVLKWEDTIEFKENVLELKKPVMLDFGAGGKGFLVDLVGKLLKSEGFKFYCIDAGGDILYRNSEQLSVGLEHPENFKQVIGTAKIKNQSICASAGNRRKWRGFHHIFNPKTKKSENSILSVWVIAKNALTADSLATCLFFVKPEILKEFDFEYLILNPDYTIEKSPDFPAEIYYN